jgi:hypothetical protein
MKKLNWRHLVLFGAMLGIVYVFVMIMVLVMKQD